MSEPLIPEIVPNSSFREFALTGLKYWMTVYEESKDLNQHMTMEEFVRQRWQNPRVPDQDVVAYDDVT